MKRIVLIPLLAAVAAGPALAAETDFTCRNQAAEITCSAQGCDIKPEGEFTPMGVSREGETLEVCAYTGCRSGTLDLIRTRGDLSILHARLADEGGAVAVVYDRRNKTATMIWGNYAQPLTCE